MPPRLGAVAAARHRAPAPLAGAAVVEEQPAAFRIGAAPDLVELRAGQQVACRPQDRRQLGEGRAALEVDIPRKPTALALERPARWRCRQRLVQGFDVGARRYL